MAIYIFNIVLTTLLSWVWTKSDKKMKRVVFILMLVMPVLIAGLRTVGTDYYNYMYRFDIIKMGYFDAKEFSFLYVLMELFVKLGLNYQHFTLFISFLIVFTAFHLICKYSEVISVPIAVFSYMTLFYQMSFNIFRQILSIEILLLALYYLNKDEKVKFAVLLAISAMLHSSSLVFGLLYFVFPFISKEKYKKLRIAVYICSVSFVFILPKITQLGAFIINKLPHYAYYFNNFSYHPIGFGMIRYISLIGISLFAINYMYKRKYGSRDELYMQFYILGKEYNINYCIFLSIIGAILWMLSYVSDSALYRIGYSGLIALPIVHGYTVKCVTNKQNKVLITACLLFLLAFFWWYDFILLNTGETYPYAYYGG